MDRVCPIGMAYRLIPLAVPAAALFDIIVHPPPLELSPLLTPLLYSFQTCGYILTLLAFEYRFPPAHRFPH